MNVEQNTCNLTTTTKRETFLPIKLSPHKSFQGKNLTGTACFVYNLAADIYANIQQWNSFHIQGVTYLRKIIQLKRDKDYSVVLQNLCDELENICNNLDSIVTNLDQIKHQLIAITALQKTTNKLFTTWPMSKFGKELTTCNPEVSRCCTVQTACSLCSVLLEKAAYIYDASVCWQGEIAETIYKTYHKEAELKRNLLENIAHNHTESWKMFYLAAWVHQPLLPENLTILLNSLFIETGHK